MINIKTIVIDCGHDAIANNSNVGYSKVYKEHLGNWEYGLKLKKYLEQYKFKVILTRLTNTPLSLSSRARIAIYNKADIFLSIHSDANSVLTVGGTTIFYSVNRPEDKIIADRIGKIIANSYGVKFRGSQIRESATRKGFDYYTILDVASNYKKIITSADFEVPHNFLIERCFHSNKAEEKLLLDENISDKSARELAKEFDSIFNVVKDSDDFMSLQIGSRGEEVKELQLNLNQLGESLVADGIYGKLSENAVKVFQEKYKLHITGIADFNTQISIKRIINKNIQSELEVLNDKYSVLSSDYSSLIKDMNNLETKIQAAISILS